MNMKLKSRIFSTFILMTGMAVFTGAVAEDSSGTVIASRGEVSAIAEGNSRELKQGDLVYVSDEILTGTRSFAVLQFTDGAKVTVRPDSKLVIESYLYAGNDNDEATLSLVSGGLRIITGAMAKTHPENYKVRTPVALMGVRGTEFSIMLCGDQICAEDEMEVN